MSFPTPNQLEELSHLLAEVGRKSNHKWYTYRGVLQILERSGGPLGEHLASTYAQHAINVAAASLHAGSSVLAPVGAAITPWIGVAEVARQAGDISDLHDLHEHAKVEKGCALRYYCICGKCADNIQYIIDKKERNVGRIAIGVATLGISVMFTKAYSMAKKLQAGRPKEQVSKALVEAGRDGCTVAIATIFLVMGNWQRLRGGNAATMRRATAVLCAEDGWVVFKAEW